jgi:transcriptional regulator with XRE-family HTH domain
MQGSLASKLRVLRAQHGYTLAEASKKTGVDRGTLSNLERGVHAPYTPTLSKIARGYGVPVEELLEEPALPGKAGALESGRPEQAESVVDLAYEAALKQTRQYQQAENRTLASEGQTQTEFARHENQVMLRLLKRNPDELAKAVFDLAMRVVQLEEENAQARRELALYDRMPIPAQDILQVMQEAESEKFSLERLED